MTRLLRPLKHSCCDDCKFRLRATETPFRYGKSKRKKNEDNHWCFNEFCINPSCNDGWYIKQICPMRKTDYNGYSKTYFYVLFERVVYGKWENKKTDSENK